MQIDDTTVIVITGASSGIGRATALAFADRKARIVLSGRDEGALEEAARECRARGGTCVCVRTDMADPASVEELGRQAVAAFERIDVWVSTAAVLAFGPFERLPLEDFYRVIATNFLGCVHGSRTALAQFRAQGDRGVLINMSSVLGLVGEPYVSPYVATKFAIRGFTSCLRQEMRTSPNLHICTVMPAAVDTPMYQRASNHSGRAVRAIFPAYDPDRVAARIVRLAERPKAETIIGGFGHLISITSAFAARPLEWLVALAGPRLQFEKAGEQPTSGSLFEPAQAPHAKSGGWRRYWRDKLMARFRRPSAHKGRATN